MTTRQDQFKAELLELLRKYDVEITAEEDTRGYETYCSGISFYSPAKYDSNYELVRETIDFKTGRGINGESEI